MSICWATSGAADPLAQVTVQWEAPAGCPSRAALDKELHRDLQGSQTPGERLAVHASVDQLGTDTWRVLIRTENSAGQSERTITAHSCTALVDATSLIIAMIIDPETAATHARPIEANAGLSAAMNSGAANSTPSAAPASSSAPPPAPPVSISQRNPSLSETKNNNPKTVPIGPPMSAPLAARPRPAGLIAAWAAADYGSLPSETEALGGSLGLLYGPWRGEASFGWWRSLNETASGSSNSLAGGEFGKFAGSTRLCLAAWAPKRFALSPCAGVELARLSGAGNKYLSPPETAHRWALSADVAILGILSITNALALRFDFDVSFPLNRPVFGITQGTEGTNQLPVFQPAWLALRAGLGVELHFR